MAPSEDTDPPANDPSGLKRLVRALRRGDRAWTAASAARFDRWLDRLERDEAHRDPVRRALLDIVERSQHIAFFADLGVLPPDGFAVEMRQRVLHKLLPADFDTDQLRDWALQLFGSQRAAAWALSVPLDRWRRLGPLLGLDALPEPSRRRLLGELFEALKILSARIASVGVDPLVAKVHPDAWRSASPFLEQQHEVRVYVDGYARALLEGRAPTEDDRHLRVLLDQCRGVVRRIRRNTSQTGVTIRLTYKLQRLIEIVERLEALLDLVDFTAAADRRADAWIRFMRLQVRACSDATSVRAMWRKGTNLVAVEITEHAGRAGEHYIAADRSQWWAMLRSAAVGGFVIAFMAIVKLLLTALHLPPLTEGVLVSLNYGLGFVLIQLLHGTVATKQPAMTAARIAAEIGEARDGEPRAWVPRVVELLVAVWRSQFIAVVGNVGVAAPLAALLTFGALSAAGVSPASADKARVLLDQLDPLSLAPLYAAMAGVCLFLSGVVSGYADNLAIFHHLPRRIGRMPLLARTLGPRRAAAVGDYVEHNFGALAGNFLFGCMLGGVTLSGTLTGLPLDIRHVAFGSANLGVAWATLEQSLAWPAVAWAALGVAVIGAINLAVSFSLSLALALRARRLEVSGIAALWRALAWRAIRKPLDLVRPPPPSSL